MSSRGRGLVSQRFRIVQPGTGLLRDVLQPLQSHCSTLQNERLIDSERVERLPSLLCTSAVSNTGAARAMVEQSTV